MQWQSRFCGLLDAVVNQEVNFELFCHRFSAIALRNRQILSSIASLLASGLPPEPLPDCRDALRVREVGGPQLRPQLRDLRFQLHLAMRDEHAEGRRHQAERGQEDPLPPRAEPPNR